MESCDVEYVLDTGARIKLIEKGDAEMIARNACVRVVQEKILVLETNIGAWTAIPTYRIVYVDVTERHP